jgi:hypothetical protein
MGLLAGCVSWNEPQWVLTEANLPTGVAYVDPPEQVDYMLAVQCGALLWAHDRPDPLDRLAPPGGTAPFASSANTYLSWAEIRARASGQNPASAVFDIAVMRDELLAGAAGATDEETRAALERTFKGELAACKSTATNADVIRVTVGG